MKIARFLCGVFSLLVIHSVLACGSPPPLDEVSFSLHAQEWAKTDTAKVVVSVDAALNNTALTKMREQIMSNLGKIAQGNWHITDFERSQDSSGLEKLYIEAEARIKEAALTNIHVNAQNISQSGMKYKVIQVDFTPSVADIEKVKKSLRETIYHQVQTEISTLNSMYPDQKYLIHQIRFGDFVSMNAARTHMMMVVGGGTPRPQTQMTTNTVSNLVTLTADVDLASVRLEKAKENKKVE